MHGPLGGAGYSGDQGASGHYQVSAAAHHQAAPLGGLSRDFAPMQGPQSGAVYSASQSASGHHQVAAAPHHHGAQSVNKHHSLPLFSQPPPTLTSRAGTVNQLSSFQDLTVQHMLEAYTRTIRQELDKAKQEQSMFQWKIQQFLDCQVKGGLAWGVRPSS